jgi:hypothetical protein
LFDSISILAGSRRRIPGEIVWINHVAWVVDRINAGSATIINISNQSKTDHISSQCDSDEPAVMHENFISAKSKAEMSKQKQMDEKQNEENKHMKELTPIETLITKAISAGKDDNKIMAMCLSNYPETPAVETVKLIAKLRKVKPPTAPPAKGKAPAPKPAAKKASKGDSIDRVAFLLDLAKAGNSELKMIQAFTKQFGDISAQHKYIVGREWRRVNGKAGSKMVCVNGLWEHDPNAGKSAPKAPAPKGKSKPVPPAPPVKKPAAKTPPPPKHSAPVEEAPAQGEEVQA